MIINEQITASVAGQQNFSTSVRPWGANILTVQDGAGSVGPQHVIMGTIKLQQQDTKKRGKKNHDGLIYL